MPFTIEEFPLREQSYMLGPELSIVKVDLKTQKGHSAVLCMEIHAAPRFYVAICFERKSILGIIPATSNSSEYDLSTLDEFLKVAHGYLDSSKEHITVISRTSDPRAIDARHWEVFFHHIASQRNKDIIEVFLHDPYIPDLLQHISEDILAIHSESNTNIEHTVYLELTTTSVEMSLAWENEQALFKRRSSKTLAYSLRERDLVLPSVESDTPSKILREQKTPLPTQERKYPLMTAHQCLDDAFVFENVTLDDLILVLAGQESSVYRIPIEWSEAEIRGYLEKVEMFCLKNMSSVEREAVRVICCHPKLLTVEGKTRRNSRAKVMKNRTKRWVFDESMWSKQVYSIKNMRFVKIPWPSSPDSHPKFMAIHARS